MPKADLAAGIEAAVRPKPTPKSPTGRAGSREGTVGLLVHVPPESVRRSG